jgi:tetratricopeptide (TPR) repeat protein
MAKFWIGVTLIMLFSIGCSSPPPQERSAACLEFESAEDYVNRADEYFTQEEYEEAITNYECAIEINPNESAYYHNVYTAYHALENYEQAAASLVLALEIEPDNAEYCWEAAEEYFFGLRNPDESLSYYWCYRDLVGYDNMPSDRLSWIYQLEDAYHPDA